MIITREELFVILLRKTEKLGREATPSDFRNDPAMPNPNEYVYYYGDFEHAAKEAYQKVRNSGPNKRAILKKPIKPVQPPAYQTIDHTKHFGRPHN